MRNSKSSVFLMELLIDILLFCVLCGCSLLIFSKSTNLINDSKNLRYASSLCSCIASVYQGADGDYERMQDFYPYASLTDSENALVLYFDKDGNHCTADAKYYTVNITPSKSTANEVTVSFYDCNGDAVYCLPVCCYIPATLEDFEGGGQ